MADQLLLARQFDDNGDPGAGYVASFFLSGTTTPETVYTDTACTIPAGDSVTADAEGRFAQTFHPGGAVLKCVIEDADGGTVETLDPQPVVSISTSAAENIDFTPTIDLPFDNVQDAIEGSVAAAASGFAAFGLGVTGNSVLLANIDATNIGAGQYRFDGTTTGTFPTGSAAANTGIIETWRETAGSAVMFLYDDTLDRYWFRRMASSTWGTWREVITANQGAAEGDILYRSSTNWTRLAKGTAGQLLQMNSGATAPEWGGRILYAAESLTGLGNVDFTSIPAWVNEIKVMFSGAASGNDAVVRLGDAGGIEATGYTSGAFNSGDDVSSETTGFVISSNGTTYNGVMILSRMTGNTWTAMHVQGGDGRASAGGGVKTLSDTLTQVRFALTSGTFTGGTVAVEVRA